MSNHHNERILEAIEETAIEMLSGLAEEKFRDLFGTPIAEAWIDEQIACGWVDRKAQELYEIYPEGPC